MAVSHVYEESWKAAYRGIVPQAYLNSIPQGRRCNSIDASGRYSLLLLDGSQIVGTASYSASRWAFLESWGEIISIYLLPDYRGKGYGASLLLAATAGLQKLGYREIFLWVLEENRTARRFYEKMGFQSRCTYREDSIGGKVLREVLYICHTGEVLKS